MKHHYIDEHCHIRSFIQQLDPRVKIASFLSLILFIIFTKPQAFLTFLLYGLLIIVLIFWSKIPLLFIFKRSLMIIPFIVLTALFVPFIKKGEIFGGYSLGTLQLTVTYDGLLILWNVTVKSYLSILCVILLMASTPFPHLLKAFEKLKFPKLMIMIFSFMYRYIFVIQDEFMKMNQAKESRSVGGPPWHHFKALSNMVGMLFIRTYERSETIYLAMCSRGFNGNIQTVDEFYFNLKDLLFISTVIATLISIRIFCK